MNIQELEVKMWNAAKNRDAQAFLELVDENHYVIDLKVADRKMQI